MADTGERDVWLSIDTAPKDGTAIEAKIDGRIHAIAWTDDLLDDDEEPCGGWQVMDDNEPPPDWTEGICWAFNDQNLPSTLPSCWRPLDLLTVGLRIGRVEE